MASDLIIFHNPDCGTSRSVLALIRHAGLQAEVEQQAVLVFIVQHPLPS